MGCKLPSMGWEGGLGCCAAQQATRLRVLVDDAYGKFNADAFWVARVESRGDSLRILGLKIWVLVPHWVP